MVASLFWFSINFRPRRINGMFSGVMHIICLMAQMVKILSAMQETWVRSLGWEDHLEKGMATKSGILTWRIPWTEEPGGLQSVGSQRVGHNWVTHTFTFMPEFSSKLYPLYQASYPQTYVSALYYFKHRHMHFHSWCVIMNFSIPQVTKRNKRWVGFLKYSWFTILY